LGGFKVLMARVVIITMVVIMESVVVTAQQSTGMTEAHETVSLIPYLLREWSLATYSLTTLKIPQTRAEREEL
jgi:hypothetical protein